ncbi:hypothetical protein IFM89_010188, partial [Coptis chinensis]
RLFKETLYLGKCSLASPNFSRTSSPPDLHSGISAILFQLVVWSETSATPPGNFTGVVGQISFGIYIENTDLITSCLHLVSVYKKVIVVAQGFTSGVATSLIEGRKIDALSLIAAGISDAASSRNRYKDMEMFLSDSDSGSSSDSSSSEYQDDIDSLYGGQAQSILSNLERSIGRIDDYLAFERSFMYGDVVCYETDPSGQLGKVVDVDIIVDVETVHGEIVKEVNCKKLLKICPFIVGDYVVKGPWLGKVSRVIDRLIILFDDGARCEVTAVNPGDIRPVCPSLHEDTQYPYYPGQHVQIRVSSIFKSSKWLWGEWKENRVEGIVCHVEAGIVHVDWVACAMIDCDMSVATPPSQQDSENLSLLSCFAHANWQLGDWCILPNNDQSIVKEQFLNVYGNGHISKQHKSESELPQGNHNPNYEEIYVIVKKKTKVDVLWQDGTCSSGLDSQSLVPVNNVGDHEFWPEQFVLEKTSCDDPNFPGGQRSGIVKSVDAKERTVRLKWKMHAGNRENDSDGKYIEETVSAYELIEHPDYTYCLGDIVFRLGKTISVFQECDNHIITSRSGQQHGDGFLSSKLPSEHSWNYNDKHYLSCIGNVIGFKDASIIVRWASGDTSKVEPGEIVGIDKYEDPVVPPVTHEDIEDKLSKEIPENDNRSSHEKDKEVLCYAGGNHTEDIWETHASFLPQAAIGFFKKIASSLFASHGSSSLSGSSSALYNHHSNQSPSEITNEFESLDEKEETKGCNLTSKQLVPLDDFQTYLKQQVEEPRENNSSISEKPGRFKQFDTVCDISDQYFVHGAGKGSMLPQVKRGWLKKVQQEWSILERDLPDTIYVRICEERVDLLRAAIVGAPGTPYHDGLFFFDFFLPPDYPNEPPHFEALVKEHFRSQSHSLLQACKAYMDGAPVGSAFSCANAAQDAQRSSSKGFKIMLAKLFPKLVSGFTDIGIDCSQFLDSGK